LTGAGWKSRFFSGIFHGETKKIQRIIDLISAINKKINFFSIFYLENKNTCAIFAPNFLVEDRLISELGYLEL
jgi:hypothetical protein